MHDSRLLRFDADDDDTAAGQSSPNSPPTAGAPEPYVAYARSPPRRTTGTPSRRRSGAVQLDKSMMRMVRDPALIKGSISSMGLCGRMCLSEYVHIEREEMAAHFASAAVVDSNGHGFGMAGGEGEGEKKKTCCHCPLRRKAVPCLLLTKLLCIFAWVGGTYMGANSLVDLFGLVETDLDAPESSPSYQA
jgi:hypothetical protein